MELNQWFEKAMSPDEYIQNMEKNKEGLLHIYENFQTPEDTDFFKKIKEKNLRAIVLTEDWCGDAMLNVPILLRLSEKAGIDVRMLLRDSNLELMDQYLTNGKARSIPIFIFIDKEGNEFTKWGPRADVVQQFVDEKRRILPPKDAEDFDEKSKELYKSMYQAFQENTEFRPEVYQSIKNALNK
ncbi:thioredoxin family protein [Oceanobacillus sp. Castelsardo]|uniref:thioredoxin family protein n=1 Tax=Oceanobacillus sp. Castelsardo TaxID=1851204 RepID=UPI0008399147|nr:thioredoxin family protein [Oceanobacillus sp. Castelsardo]